MHINHETETRGKYLPWRKKTLVTTTEEEREERAIIGSLTSTDLLANAGSPEPVIVNEMKIVLPYAFFREIQKSVLHDAKIGNRLSTLFFMKQSKDEQLRQMSASEQITFFTELLTNLLTERNADPVKIDEFSEWIQRASVLAYDFDRNILTPIN